MIDETIQNSKRHSGAKISQGLTREIELDDESHENIDLVAIERTWSKRLEQLETKLSDYNSEPIPSISYENPRSDPLARWYSETTADGFFHNIGEVRKLSKRPNVHLDFKNHSQILSQKFDTYGREVESDAGATCGLLSEISRGLARL